MNHRGDCKGGPMVVLASGPGWHVQDLRRAAGTRGVELVFVPFETLEGRVGARAGTAAIRNKLDDARAVLVRMMPPGSLEQVVYRMDALHRLEAQGVPVINPPRAVEAAVDKYLTLARLEQHGLDVPPTWVGESAEAAMQAFEELGGDVVIKPLFGSEGRGLIRVADREVAWRAFHAIERMRSVLYLQAFVPHNGFDMRLFVIGGRVVCAMKRHAQQPEWRTNVAQGGRAEPLAVDECLASLAVRAAAAVGAEVAGVDLLRSTQGQVHIIEVNAVPGWKALASVTQVDVASQMIQHAIQRAAP